MKRLIIFSIMIAFSNANAWENTRTHRDISDAAAKMSLTDEQINSEYEFNGKNQNLLEWVKDGAELEDAGSLWAHGTARFRNHFHNPLASLSAAGLSDLMSGESTVLWAQDGTNQANFVEGDWSWQTVRNHYYHSLTSANKTEIDEFTVRTYLGLGYQMHLVQDMSQPDHVRNDAHPVDGAGIQGFEKWAKKKFLLIRQYAASATKPTVDLKQPLEALVPVGRLMDTRRYFSDRTPSSDMNQGLAEYTNANFFSDDSVFAARFATDDKHYFPFPRKEGTDIQTFFSGTKQPEIMQSEDGKSVKGLWISKISEGEAVSHLVRVGPLADFYYSEFGEGTLFYDSLYRDEITHEDYTRLLIPRAVGYSASLLDYFFRGKIELSLPSRGVYALAAPNDQFSEIRVRAKNMTASGEEMSNGTIQLVVKYNLSLSDPYQSVLVDLGPDTYIVIPEITSNLPDEQRIKTIPKEAPVELTFDLSETPLPLWAANVSIQVVYKGQLGNEADSVAVGYKDISEPTPVDVYNNTDYSCLNSSWYRYDDPAAMAIVDSDEDGIADRSDIYPHTITNIAFLGGPANAGTLYASISNNLFSPGPLQTGQLLRMGYILSDYEYRYAINENRTGQNGDPYVHATVNNRNFSGHGFRNDMSTQYVMYLFRGYNMWWGSGVIFINTEYNGTCSFDSLNQLLGY